MISRIRQELASFGAAEKCFIFFAMLTGFCIAAEYGITRPASNSLFLSCFTAQLLPHVWLATVPLNLLIVTLYNRYLPQIGPWKMLCAVSSAAIGINLATGLFVQSFPWIIFFQAAWKDIYILLMFKQLWSMIHNTIPSSRAKYLYGIIFGMGTIGTILGNLVPGFLAVWAGSKSLFFATLPLYLLLLYSYRKAHLSSPVSTQVFSDLPSNQTREGFSLIFRSRYLVAVLLIVVLMQISAGLIEFRFNSYLEQYIVDQDLRTEYMGRLSSIMNLLSGALQIVGSFLMVHTLGVRNSHLSIPIVLLLSALGSIIYPSFAVLTFTFVLLKGIDYSLFSVIREMLYIPMQLDEKYRAKAIIDVFAYRSSKALVSIAIIGLQFFSNTAILSYVSSASVAVFVLWIAVVWFLLRKHYPRPVTV